MTRWLGDMKPICTISTIHICAYVNVMEAKDVFQTNISHYDEIMS